MNIKLNISYDGTSYHGWQVQSNAVTIQQLLTEAIVKITRETVSITGCSRTDAGVHAQSYTCNYYSMARIPMDKLPLALNTVLPCDIRVKRAEIVPEEFNSRFSAKSKTYQYKIWNQPIADPFWSRYSYHFPQQLNLINMEQAAQTLVGEHDFSAFMASGGSQKTTVRCVNSLALTEDKGCIIIEINANAYLYNMVRIIAGTLIYAGCGKLTPTDVKTLLTSKKRVDAGITAPPHGLFLTEVYY